MSLVEETFNPNPKTVDTRSTEGNDEKSMARGVYMTRRRMRNESSKFTAISKSSRTVGNGIMSIITTTITPTATNKSTVFLNLTFSAMSPHPAY
jgi:hypothetical protein